MVKKQLYYSFVIPVYNRPQEVRELLQSMTALTFNRAYEIVIIEDGSSIPCRDIVNEFIPLLPVTYYQKPNSGPGASRNYGMKRAKGDYFLILDSDVILPPNYLLEVDSFLSKNKCECFGGPDAAHTNFSIIQKAINYSMTSFFTTGGIRGNKRAVDKFQPRSFNMGLSKEAFELSGGFGSIHPGEDPDLSLRLGKLGLSTCLIPNAFVYHKRRINWGKFFSQVLKFGMVRPILNKWHPQAAKITYWFPSVFIIGLLIAILLALVGIPVFLYIYVGYIFIICADAAITYKSFYIGVAAVVATFIQFLGYGYGFLKSIWMLKVLNIKPQIAFPDLFFNDAKED